MVYHPGPLSKDCVKHDNVIPSWIDIAAVVEICKSITLKFLCLDSKITFVIFYTYKLKYRSTGW